MKNIRIFILSIILSIVSVSMSGQFSFSNCEAYGDVDTIYSYNSIDSIIDINITDSIYLGVWAENEFDFNLLSFEIILNDDEGEIMPFISSSDCYSYDPSYETTTTNEFTFGVIDFNCLANACIGDYISMIITANEINFDTITFHINCIDFEFMIEDIDTTATVTTIEDIIESDIIKPVVLDFCENPITPTLSSIVEDTIYNYTYSTPCESKIWTFTFITEDIPNTLTEFSTELLNIYPNPVTDILYLENCKSYRIINSSGQIVSIGNSNTVITKAFASGLYFLISDDGSVLKFKKE